MNKYIIKAFILIVLFLNGLLNAYTQTYYVSPNGSGSNFTQENPGSIEDVREAVRLANRKMNSECYLTFSKMDN